MELLVIQKKIFEIRGQRVMLDFHLAELYAVETKMLKRAVNRNIKRFPPDFMIQLTTAEYNSLRYQIGTLKRGQHSKYLPYAFTQEGVAMLSSVLKSNKAIDINISIMRAFVFTREYALSHKDLTEKLKQLEHKYNRKFNDVYEAINYLMQKDKQETKQKKRKKIGFKLPKK
ncbi:MAG TPA: ORF6N domain-containing protein [Bacteroidia bacterium]|nr:ORF6N domain-containing protein [Bacteroidia bacterium]